MLREVCVLPQTTPQLRSLGLAGGRGSGEGNRPGPPLSAALYFYSPETPLCLARGLGDPRAPAPAPPTRRAAQPACTSWLHSRSRPGAGRRCSPCRAPGLARRRAARQADTGHWSRPLHPWDTDGCSKDNGLGVQAQLCLRQWTGGWAGEGPVPRPGVRQAGPGEQGTYGSRRPRCWGHGPISNQARLLPAPGGRWARHLRVWCWERSGAGLRGRGEIGKGPAPAPRVGEKGRPLVGCPGAADKAKAAGKGAAQRGSGRPLRGHLPHCKPRRRNAGQAGAPRPAGCPGLPSAEASWSPPRQSPLQFQAPPSLAAPPAGWGGASSGHLTLSLPRLLSSALFPGSLKDPGTSWCGCPGLGTRTPPPMPPLHPVSFLSGPHPNAVLAPRPKPAQTRASLPAISLRSWAQGCREHPWTGRRDTTLDPSPSHSHRLSAGTCDPQTLYWQQKSRS